MKTLLLSTLIFFITLNLNYDEEAENDIMRAETAYKEDLNIWGTKHKF